MDDAKFMVYGGGRWRELNLASGRVSGWGQVGLLCQRRGRLEIVPRASVLSALRALAAGRVSAARDGPNLPQQRKERGGLRARRLRAERLLRAHTCCHPHVMHCGTDANCNSILKVHAAVQAPPSARPGRENDQNTHNSRQPPALRGHGAELHNDRVLRDKNQEGAGTKHSPARRKRTPQVLRKNDGAQEPKKDTDHKQHKSAPESKALLRRSNQTCEGEGAESRAASVSTSPRKRDHERQRQAPEHRRPLQKKNGATGSSSDASVGTISRIATREQTPCKELRISEAEVALLRGFLQRDRRNVFGVELRRFDADAAYRARLLYRLHPLVALRRCPRTAARAFAGALGLRDADRWRGAEQPGAAADAQAASDGASASTRGRRTRTRTPSEGEAGGDAGDSTSTRKAARGYSAAEDALLLRWVRRGARARLVNGNRVWRQLQPAHRAAAGRFRSWQSLRNRYLRHLLPALHALLPPHEAARLRAAAARGELKARKAAPRRNSAFAAPRVRSAWAARAPPAAPAAPPPAARTPTYSELTKRFARRPRSTPSSDSGAASPRRSSRSGSDGERRAGLRKRGRAASPDSEHGRAAKRRRSSPSRAAGPAAAGPAADGRRRSERRAAAAGRGSDASPPRRTRRLFNPKAM